MFNCIKHTFINLFFYKIYLHTTKLNYNFFKKNVTRIMIIKNSAINYDVEKPKNLLAQ